MGVRLTSGEKKVALFDSTSGFAFGPVFDNDGDAEDFLRHLARNGYQDARDVAPQALVELHNEWMEPRL